MLSIDGLPWALPKAEDECCAFGAKHIRETPFPILKERRLGQPPNRERLARILGNRDAALVSARVSHAPKKQTDAAGHVLNSVNKWAIDFHFDRRRGR